MFIHIYTLFIFSVKTIFLMNFGELLQSPKKIKEKNYGEEKFLLKFLFCFFVYMCVYMYVYTYIYVCIIYIRIYIYISLLISQYLNMKREF